MTVAIAFLFGLLIGSFLNVCIYRLPRDLSVARPRRSFCPDCNAAISWYENIPLVSYLVLRGRCRSCGARISLRYPLVELATGALFAAAVARYGISPQAGKTCLVAALLLGLIFTDLEQFVLPEEFTLGGLGAALVMAWFIPVPGEFAPLLLSLAGVDLPPRAGSFAEAVFAASIPSSFLWLSGWIYEKVRGREGLGLGDVFMMAMMGAFLGLQLGLLAMIAGSVLGSVTGLLYLAITRQDPATTHLPFGTFLGIGGLLATYAGEPLLAWYTGIQ